MRKTIGTVWGVEIYFVQSALTGTAVLFVVFTLLALLFLPIPPWQAVVGGLLATAFHWLCVIVHHLGHAWAARQVGHPMTRIRLMWVLATSLYPRNEAKLPAQTHLFRAIGGPVASLLLAVAAGLLSFFLPDSRLMLYLLLFLTADSFFVFCLGALLPLGFTDGSTLLHWWPQRR